MNLGYLAKWRIVTFRKAGCPTGLADFVQPGKLTGSVWQDCGTFHQNLIEKMAALKAAAIVISSQTQWVLTTPAPNHVATPAEMQAALAGFIRELPSSSKVVILAGFPTPGNQMIANPLTCLGRSPKAPSDCNFTEQPAVAAANDVFTRATADAGAGFIDQGPWFCTTECPSIIDGLILLHQGCLPCQREIPEHARGGPAYGTRPSYGELATSSAVGATRGACRWSRTP